MKRLILLSIIFGTSLVVAGLILGFYLFPGAYVTDISGTVIEGISKEPIEGINVCWERYFEPFGHGHTVTDNGCVKTNNNGRYQIPTSESKKAIYLDIYFNLDGKKRNMSLSPEYIQKDYEERGTIPNLEASTIYNKEFSSYRRERLAITEIPISGTIDKSLFNLNQNPEECNSVEEEDYNQYYCYLYLGLYNALKNKDSSYCEFIPIKESSSDIPLKEDVKYRERNYCKRTLEIYYKGPEHYQSSESIYPCAEISWRLGLNEICNGFLNTSILEYCEVVEDKDICYWQIGVKYKNVEACEKTTTQKDGCLGIVSTYLKDESICLKIEEPTSKDLCYMGRASDLNNLELCNEIQDTQIKEQCIRTPTCLHLVNQTQKYMNCIYGREVELVESSSSK